MPFPEARWESSSTDRRLAAGDLSDLSPRSYDFVIGQGVKSERGVNGAPAVGRQVALAGRVALARLERGIFSFPLQPSQPPKMPQKLDCHESVSQSVFPSLSSRKAS
jgi:hypothetical protein